MRLPRILDLGVAGALRDGLAQARGANLEVDASEVERLGALCAQVLVAASKAWRGNGQEFRVANPSEAFKDASRLMGLDAAFGLGDA